MSVNYLAALAWQEDNLQLAVEEMNRHGNAPQCDSPADLVSRLSEVVANAAVSPFNAVNYLRIAASQAIAGDTPTPEALASIGDYWKPQLTPDHPYEQLAKWLGFLHQITGSHLEADTLYTNAVAICEKLDFTLHTIGLSIVGLQASNCAASGAENTYAKHLNHLREWGTALQAQSTPFADYLAGFGGIEGLVESVKERDQKAALSIARSLPFNYA
jgi:hypothetical protein